MPFTKVGPNKYKSPSGRTFSKKQVALYYATNGFSKKKKWMLDFTVNLGNLLTIIAFLVGGTSFIQIMKGQVSYLASRLEVVEVELKKLSEILVKLGRQDERLTAMDKRVMAIENDLRDLRRGKGFIVERDTQ